MNRTISRLTNLLLPPVVAAGALLGATAYFNNSAKYTPLDEHEDAMMGYAKTRMEIRRSMVKLEELESQLDAALAEADVATREFDMGMYDIFKIGGRNADQFQLNLFLFQAYNPETTNLSKQEIGARVLSFTIAEDIVLAEFSSDSVAELSDWEEPYRMMGLAQTPQELVPVLVPEDKLGRFIEENW